MNTKIKKNLWWIITSIVLFVPIVFFICEVSGSFGEKLSFGTAFFVILFLIWAITGLAANKIKNIVLKVLWIIFGLVVYAICWIFIVICIAMCYTPSEEEYEERKEGFRDMIYSEFSDNEELDRIVGFQLPQYEIVDSKCEYVSQFPAETEYDVKLKIHFQGGLPKSIWNKIYKLASKKASNKVTGEYAINEWGFYENNPKIISYQLEDASNSGCVVTFNHLCDTVYVTRYKW